MAQWINLNRKNRSVLAHRHSVLSENLALYILLLLVGLTAGRQASRRNMGEFQNFNTFLQVKLFGLLFCLMSLQFYCSVRNCIQSAFVKLKFILRCVLKCK